MGKTAIRASWRMIVQGIPITAAAIEVIQAASLGGAGQYTIAEGLGVSRATVAKYVPRPDPPPSPYCEDPVLSDVTGFCPGCGRKMLRPTAGWPCLACRVQLQEHVT